MGGKNSCASGNTVFVNDTEVSEINATSTDFVIKTGLPSIKKFCFMSSPTTSSMVTWRSIVTYDADVDANNYCGSCTYSSGGYGGTPLAIGTGQNSQVHRVMSISGGDIYMKSASATNYGAVNNISWIASAE